jgi:hypothetical protein
VHPVDQTGYFPVVAGKCGIEGDVFNASGIAQHWGDDRSM